MEKKYQLKNYYKSEKKETGLFYSVVVKWFASSWYRSSFLTVVINSCRK